MEPPMYVLQLWVQYLEKFAEISAQDEESASLVIEELAGLALSHLPGTITIEDVKLRFSPLMITGMRRCIIDVYIHLPELIAPRTLRQIRKLEIAAENGMGCRLMELFGGIYGISIEQVLLRSQRFKQRGILRPVRV